MRLCSQISEHIPKLPLKTNSPVVPVRDIHHLCESIHYWSDAFADLIVDKVVAILCYKVFMTQRSNNLYV